MRLNVMNILQSGHIVWLHKSSYPELEKAPASAGLVLSTTGKFGVCKGDGWQGI